MRFEKHATTFPAAARDRLSFTPFSTGVLVYTYPFVDTSLDHKIYTSFLSARRSQSAVMTSDAKVVENDAHVPCEIYGSI